MLLRLETGGQGFIANHQGYVVYQRLGIAGSSLGGAQLGELGLETWMRGNMSVLGKRGVGHGYGWALGQSRRQPRYGLGMGVWVWGGNYSFGALKHGWVAGRQRTSQD